MPARASAILLLLVALQSAAIELPRDADKWFEVRADDIRIFTNASPAAAQNLAREVLRMRAAIGQVTNLEVRTPVTTRIFLFADERSFAPYRDAAFPGQGRAEGINGAFLSGEEQNVILLRGDAANVDRTVYHELAHYFVNNSLPSLPLWVREGLADYYSTFRVSKDGIDIGLPVDSHVTWLRREPLVPLRELVSVTLQSPMYNERRRAGAFYAQSWALVHYLLRGNQERRPQFFRYLQLTNAGEPLHEAFTAAFGIPYAKLEQELRDYVRKQTIHYARYTLDEVKIAEPPRPAPMPRDVLLYELGQLVSSLDLGLAANAARFFEAALKENPRNSSAWAYLGRVHAQLGRQKESEAAFARAVEIGTDDGDVYFLLGRAIIDRANNEAVVPQAEVLKARAMFARAVELQPDSLRAWQGLAVTYLHVEDDLAPGMAAAQRAIALAPANELTTRVLGLLRERQHVRDINTAIEIANRGQFAEAVAKLDRLIPTIRNQQILQDARKLRDDMAKRVKR